ncbi:MAG: rod shape-determining protein [Bdellovibrionales bacterium]
MFWNWFKGESPTAADIYVDLGTANTLVAARGFGIILNEPSIVAYSETSPGRRRILAIGSDVKEILNKTPGNTFLCKPIRDGVIADFDFAQEMLKHFLSRPLVQKAFSRPRVVVSLPYGVTEVEKKAVVEACLSSGAREVFLIDEPMAAAIGANLPIKSPRGSMIVDIGGGTTEIAVIALSDIVYCEAVKVGGHKMDESILDYFKKTKKLIISEPLAEELKVHYGTAVPRKNIRSTQISGRDADTGLSKTLEITSEDVGMAINDCLEVIINGIHRALEKTPPELVADLIETGLVLAGGGALIRDFDIRIQSEVRIPVKIAAQPLTAIAIGGSQVLEDPSLLSKIQLEI